MAGLSGGTEQAKHVDDTLSVHVSSVPKCHLIPTHVQTTQPVHRGHSIMVTGVCLYDPAPASQAHAEHIIAGVKGRL